MKKKILGILSIMTLAGALVTGCGEKKEETEAPTEVTEANDETNSNTETDDEAETTEQTDEETEAE